MIGLETNGDESDDGGPKGPCSKVVDQNRRMEGAEEDCLEENEGLPYYAGKRIGIVSTGGDERSHGEHLERILTQEAVMSQFSRNKSWRAWSRVVVVVVKSEMEMEIARPMAEERIMTTLGTLLEKAATDSGVLFPSTSS